MPFHVAWKNPGRPTAPVIPLAQASIGGIAPGIVQADMIVVNEVFAFQYWSLLVLATPLQLSERYSVGAALIASADPAAGWFLASIMFLLEYGIALTSLARYLMADIALAHCV